MIPPRSIPKPIRGLSESGPKFLSDFEGIYLNCYRDPVGIPTIGIGHVGCTMGQQITIDRAYELLRQDAKIAENAVWSSVTYPFNDFMEDAMISIAFNIGANGFATSTLVKKLNAGDVQGAANEFLRWKYAGGRVLAGLLRRRQAERVLFLQGPVEAFMMPKLTKRQLQVVKIAETTGDVPTLEKAADRLDRLVQISRRKKDLADGEGEIAGYKERVAILRREEKQARDRLRKLDD